MTTSTTDHNVQTRGSRAAETRDADRRLSRETKPAARP